MRCGDHAVAPLRLGAAQVLVEPRHQLDEIAGPIAVVELVHEDFVPGVAAGAGRAGQAEDEGRVGDARGRARLDRRRADLRRRSPCGTAVEKPSMRFSNSGSTASGVTSRPVKPVPPVVITTSIAGSAIQARICARISSTSSVTIARPATRVPRLLDPLGERAARLVVLELARIGNRQHRNLQRHERTLVVDAWHGGGFPNLERRKLQRSGRKRVAGLHRTLLEAGHEPALALLGRAMGKAVGHDVALRALLQHVIADRRRGLQCRLDVAGLQQLPAAARRGAPRRRQSSRPAARRAPEAGSTPRDRPRPAAPAAPSAEMPSRFCT